jgi:hypothetical protein
VGNKRKTLTPFSFRSLFDIKGNSLTPKIEMLCYGKIYKERISVSNDPNFNGKEKNIFWFSYNPNANYYVLESETIT